MYRLMVSSASVNELSTIVFFSSRRKFPLNHKKVTPKPLRENRKEKKSWKQFQYYNTLVLAKYV